MAGLFDYKSYDGKIYEGLSISDALLLKQKDEEKKSAGDKTAKAQEVMAKLEQLSTSGNYSLEGAMALAAKNQVFDDPNVQAYIKNMGDDLINKNTDAQFGIGNRQNMGVPPPSTQQAPANTLSGMSSGPVFGEQGLPSTEGDDTAELERFFSGWNNNSSGGSSYSPPPEQATPPAGNTVLSALNGGQPAMTPPTQEQPQNSFITRLPNEMQQFIKRTGLSEAEYELPVREYLIKRDWVKLSKDIRGLTVERIKRQQLLDLEELKQSGESTRNTESVKSSEKIATGNNQTSLDVANIYAGARGRGVDDSGLTEIENLAAYSLAREIGGVRGATNIYPTVVAGLKAGKTINDMRDEIRHSQQSESFVGAARSAMQQLYAGKQGKAVDAAYDSFDDLLAKNDTKGIQSFLKRSARNSVGEAASQQIFGKERTVEFLSEIRNDLANYEKLGGRTNVFSGAVEDVAKKVGTVNDPELRKIATKIASALQTYRRSMSGVAFSVPESKEYGAMFPSIGKTGKFNTAVLDALTETFDGDVEYFYKSAMGENGYNTFIAKTEQGTGAGGAGSKTLSDPLGIR
jgi:hypothetical protein